MLIFTEYKLDGNGKTLLVPRDRIMWVREVGDHCMVFVASDKGLEVTESIEAILSQLGSGVTEIHTPWLRDVQGVYNVLSANDMLHPTSTDDTDATDPDDEDAA